MGSRLEELGRCKEEDISHPSLLAVLRVEHHWITETLVSECRGGERIIHSLLYSRVSIPVVQYIIFLFAVPLTMRQSIVRFPSFRGHFFRAVVGISREQD
jgi:hypothetical protein